MKLEAPQCGHREGHLLRGEGGSVLRHLSSLTIKMAFAGDSGAFDATNHGAIENQNPVDIDTQTRICPGTRAKLEKLCSNCGEWVGLGGKGSSYTFLLHQDGERCRRTAKLKASAWAEEGPRLPVASTSFEPKPLPTFAAPPLSTYQIPVLGSTVDRRPCGPPELSFAQSTFSHSDIPMTATSPFSSPLASPPSLVLPEQTPCTSPAMDDAMTLDTLETSPLPLSIPTNLPPITPLSEQASLITTYPGFLTATKVPCHGVRLKWECGHSSKTYPFQYHDTDSPTWSVMTRRPPDPDVIYLQSFSCALFHDTSTEACFECLKVPSSDKFQSLVLKASKDPAPTVPWGYLSWEQIFKRLKDRTDECRQYRKKVSSTSQRRTQC